MATGAVIGALRVVLGADTAALDKGMKDAQSSLQSFTRDIGKIAAGVGLERIVEKSVAALVGGVKHAVTVADELGKAAQKIGIPVEELSKLEFAAKIADVSLETLTATLIKFDKNMTEAANGGANDLSKALEAMGVQLRNGDGSLKSQSQLLEDVADKFASYEDSAAKTNIALALFGKRGAELIPFLNQGGDGIRKLKEEADRLGLTITGNTAKASEEFNDNMRRLTAVVEGMFRAVAAGLAPALQTLSQQFVATSQDGQLTETRFEGISRAVKLVVEDLTIAIVKIKGAGREFMALWDVVGGKPFSEITESWRKFNEAGEQTEKEIRIVKGELALAGQSAIQFAMDYGTASAAIVKGNAPLVGGTKAAKDALQSFLDTTEKSTAARAAEASTVGMGVAAIEKFRVMTEATTIAQQNNIPISEAMRQKIAGISSAAADATLKLQGANLIWENTDPLKKFQIESANNEAAMRRMGATSAEIARQQQKDAAKIGETWEQTGGSIASIAGSMSTLTKTLGKENKAMGIASKAFGIAQVIINTEIAAMKALAELGPIAGPIAAAAAVAAGAASIATIAAQSFAQGGSFQVPGGMSMTDNQLVPLNLASGERVDITPANTAGSSSTVTVDMRGGDPYYSRGNVEKLLNAMHTVMADGHQVQLVVLK